MKTKDNFNGSLGWLLFWIVLFPPIAIWYYWNNQKELMEAGE